MCVSTQSCPTLCDPMDYSLPGSPVYGIFQARILEWIAIYCSRASSWLRAWTLISCVFCIDKRVLNHCTTWEALYLVYMLFSKFACLCLLTLKSLDFWSLSVMGSAEDWGGNQTVRSPAQSRLTGAESWQMRWSQSWIMRASVYHNLRRVYIIHVTSALHLAPAQIWVHTCLWFQRKP